MAMQTSPMQAAFHLPYSLLGLCLAIRSDRLPGSLAKVSDVDGDTPNGLSDA